MRGGKWFKTIFVITWLRSKEAVCDTHTTKNVNIIFTYQLGQGHANSKTIHGTFTSNIHPMHRLRSHSIFTSSCATDDRQTLTRHVKNE